VVTSIEKALAELDAARQRAQEAIAHNQNLEFWRLWRIYSKPPTSLQDQIIGVAKKYYNFQFRTSEMKQAFIFDVLCRCKDLYPRFDQNKAHFITWVCWQARGLASEIIRTGQEVPLTGPMGVGLQWPYDWMFEMTLTELIPPNVEEEEFEWEKMDILSCEDRDERQLWLRRVGEWISTEIDKDKSGEVERVVNAILKEQDSRRGPRWVVPGPDAIAGRAKISLQRAQMILHNLRRSYIAFVMSEEGATH
jgi:hypothetical protein